MIAKQIASGASASMQIAATHKTCSVSLASRRMLLLTPTYAIATPFTLTFDFFGTQLFRHATFSACAYPATVAPFR